MRQYHVKLHFHKQKGNYFAYDMWQWQDQVEGKSVSFSKLDYFGVEGNLVYESEGALNRGHVLVKEGDWLTKTRDFEIELLPEGMFEKCGFLMETIQSIILCKLL